MQRSMTVADLEAIGGCDRRTDPRLGIAHGSLNHLDGALVP